MIGWWQGPNDQLYCDASRRCLLNTVVKKDEAKCIEGEFMSIYVCSESEGNGALILGFTFQEVAARFARGCRNERVNKSTINCEDCLYFIHLDIFCCDSSAPRYVLGRDEDLDDPNKMQHFRDTNLPARCQGADQLTKDLLSLFSKVPDSFKKQYQAGKSSEKLLWLGEVATWISSNFDTF